MGVDVLTFGCRLNSAESDTMRARALAAGEDDLVIVNTCAVTAEATRQARQAIRRAARERPGTRIVVTGCAAQIEPDRFAAMPEVDRVLGNAGKLDAGAWAPAGGGSRIAVGDIAAARGTAMATTGGRVRAFVQVQNGCDHRCTFCVIPQGRGPSRSVAEATVLAELRRLVGDGVREVVLTGVDITSYGTDLAGTPRLGSLVKSILHAVPDLARLRLSSIDSVEADADLLDAFATEPRLMPHLHLSLQAGDDLVLKRMRRRHLRADAIAFCADVRRLRPDVVFGADLIAGFPTETEAMFARSLDLVAECGLTHLHVFPYSARPGTPAARMPAVAPGIARDRARRLREAGRSALGRHLDREVGRTLAVLAESATIGRTEGYATVRLREPARPGEIRSVTVGAHDGSVLIAA